MVSLSGEEKRFSLCHELGHMVLARPLRHVLAAEVREELANWFARSTAAAGVGAAGSAWTKA